MEREARGNRADFHRLLEMMRVRLTVEGPGIQYGVLTFGEVPAGKGKKRVITILKPCKSDTEFTCNLPFVTARVRESFWREGYVYSQRVYVELSPDAPKGEFAGALIVDSRAPVAERRSIAIRGAVM